MAIHVIDPGALTTVQDMGRIGLRKFGIPRCGAMDQHSYALANRILHNDSSCAVLECTLYGGKYRFDCDTAISLTGADMQPALNGSPIRNNCYISVKNGDILSLGYARSGCRTYVGVSGGIQVPIVMGSRSTFMKCAIGGYQGRALRAGDDIPCSAVNPDQVDLGKTPDRMPDSDAVINSSDSYPDEILVRVIPGPQDDHFTEAGIHTFFSCAYRMSEKSDRMGCRLEGPAVESVHGCDIISDGIVCGCVQITSAGQPIILMADAQTTGGYAKIGTVHSDDLPKLAQCKSGGTVRFQKTLLTIE